MKPTEKRKSTQPGLGKVSGDARHSTSKRERVDAEVLESVPPISAPPPSTGPIRSQTPQGRISGAPTPRQTLPMESSRPRHTKGIESTGPSDRATTDDVPPIDARTAREVERPVERTPSPPPASVRGDSRPAAERVERVERIERIDVISERPPSSVRGGALVSRTPIEVTQVDTKRIPRVGSSPSTSSSAGRFPTEEATGRRPILNREAREAREARDRDERDPRSEPGSRTVDGRPIKRADSARPAVGSSRPAPTSGRPSPAPSGRPVPSSARPTSARPTNARPASVRPPPSAHGVSTGTARSARVSIREDNVGAAIHAEPARGSRRVVPKVLKSKAEIAAAPIDHRAGFLLAHVDGVTTVAGLVDICGMPEDQVNGILDRLCRLGIVALR